MAGLLEGLLRHLYPQPPAGSPGLGLLGSGMAGQAAQVLQSRPYQLHVQEMQALGQQPMTPDQFLMQQAAQAK